MQVRPIVHILANFLIGMLVVTCSSEKSTSSNNSFCEFRGITATDNGGNVISADTKDWCYAPTSQKMSLSSVIPVPTSYSLYPAYPNPAQTVSNITFALPKETRVSVTIMGKQGLPVEASEQSYPAGVYRFVWDCSNELSGMYCVRVQAGNFSCGGDIMVAR
jgi:hypothetical protein